MVSHLPQLVGSRGEKFGRKEKEGREIRERERPGTAVYTVVFKYCETSYHNDDNNNNDNMLLINTSNDSNTN